MAPALRRILTYRETIKAISYSGLHLKMAGTAMDAISGQN